MLFMRVLMFQISNANALKKRHLTSSFQKKNDYLNVNIIYVSKENDYLYAYIIFLNELNDQSHSNLISNDFNILDVINQAD